MCSCGFLVELRGDCINFYLFKTMELNIRVKSVFFKLRGDRRIDIFFFYL